MKKQTFIEYSKIILVSLLICAITAVFSAVQFILGENLGKSALTVSQNEPYDKRVIVIDAGHGGEDGGAVGNSGTLEKDINLSVAVKVKNMLELSGFDVVMTRESDSLLYNESQSDRKKFYDLRNRVEATKNCENPVFVSIHQNKFPLEKYKGLQVYFSPNNKDSEILAGLIQSNTAGFLQKDNRRHIKQAGRNIYVLKNLDCPAVLVECGFLSNPDEERLLNDSGYQNKLAFIIFKSVTEYLSNYES